MRSNLVWNQRLRRLLVSAAGLCAISLPTLTHAAPSCDNFRAKSFDQLSTTEALPNPFVFADGGAVIRSSDWYCRRQETAQQIQRWIYGEKEPAPKQITGEVNAQSVTVKIIDNGKRIAFTAEITLPNTGDPPYPAMIGIGRSFLDNQALLDRGIALINFPNNELGQQDGGHSRGKGKFYALYGENHSAASTMAWAWGVSRLIDALELTQGHRIDTQHLGVTGCSRNGKGALVTGAFDERIALSIIQESGSGGSAAWRVSDAQLASGQNVQTARQIVTENTWLREDFTQFSESVSKLPVDNHQLMGLVAPRGLLLLENTGMEWLGNESAYTSALAAREIYFALGAEENMGITQVGGHQHCQVPDSQKPAINAFVDRFLLDKDVDTNLTTTDGEFSVDRERWMPWPTPKLR
ncbi:dockerin-like protein [Gilvimarinus sp. SDUM040013]|uniref:Dockerin-like protein n=1 Tax=Gilvimarinus gilvus TaxID=3058038 RepID=A0ABU4RSB6_9GAMM|nr:dockerin-like protein [Gilvimarinus sp. SDUM040013]MDO3388232.1 dockerin-like protein [Gilvimarinus sp. SDUM040013]MDX6847782.1 dockerin-like protein [Gilvimarinus sp. SDUM040013]